MVEFRAGAAARSADLVGDSVAINGESVLRLLYGAGEELEGIVVWHASQWLPDPPASTPPSRAGTSYVPDGDALTIQLFKGKRIPAELHGGTVTFTGGLEVALSLDADGRLMLAIVFSVSRWLPPGALRAGEAIAQLRVLRVAGEDDTVFLELVPGGSESTTQTEGLEVEGFEIHAAYDSNSHLVGFLVPGASRVLPSPFNEP